jgi:hypothetical protein
MSALYKIYPKIASESAELTSAVTPDRRIRVSLSVAQEVYAVSCGCQGL